jgi:hypothetical protein
MAKDLIDPDGTEASAREVTPETPSMGTDELRESGSHHSVEPASTKPISTISAGEADVVSSTQSRPAVSQPMTASNSSSSHTSLKEAATGTTASPYGTRSRNRGGASRPNYAEDREMEEFVEQPPVKEEDSRKVARQSDVRSLNGVDLAGTANVIRRSAGTQSEYNSNGQLIAKDHIPGTSTFSANPTAAIATLSSKKRKAAGQSTPTISTSTATTGTIADSQPTTRRTSIAAQIGISSRESNMLTFESCAGALKDGKLVADDGTILGVNGK